MKGAFNCNPSRNNHDNYFTRKSAWKDIECFIPRDKVIWEAFFHPLSNSGVHLIDMGFNVVSSDVDFFTEDKGDIVVSNPPFSLKKEAFARLKELNKPFILLVPSSCIQTQYFLDIFKGDKIQLIIPCKKRQFDQLGDDGQFVKRKDNCSFYTLYICWKMGFDQDVYFI